jgi:rare lipoprotein A
MMDNRFENNVKRPEMCSFNNKPYLARLTTACVLLCAGLSPSAKGDTLQEVMQQKLVQQEEAVKTEEIKTKPSEPADTDKPATETMPIEAIGSVEEKAAMPAVQTISGLASFYATKFNGRRTASGERFNSKLLTAAHLSLPFGSLLKVTNPSNSQSVIVRINDRGPYIQNRVIDLTRAAADLLGITRLGVAQVEIEILNP